MNPPKECRQPSGTGQVQDKYRTSTRLVEYCVSLKSLDRFLRLSDKSNNKQVSVVGRGINNQLRLFFVSTLLGRYNRLKNLRNLIFISTFAFESTGTYLYDPIPLIVHILYQICIFLSGFLPKYAVKWHFFHRFCRVSCGRLTRVFA